MRRNRMVPLRRKHWHRMSARRLCMTRPRSSNATTEFWVFTTGRGVPSLHSKDLVNWDRGPAIFSDAPPWVAEAVPANRGMGFWAPDVTYLNGRYLVYYAASSFGKCVSGIGLVTSPTLDPNDPAYHWTDQGLVVASAATDDFNAIDPAIFHDTTTAVSGWSLVLSGAASK